MKLALHQGPPIGGDVEAGLARIDAVARAAALVGAQMVVFPELFLPGYNRPDLHAAMAQPRDGEWAGRVAAIARAASCGITLGWAERDGEAVYNAASAFGADGAALGHYRKIQLFGAMENASFSPGSDYCLFDLCGVRTGLLICYDVEFAPHVRALAQRGAKLVLVPTANPTGFEHVSTAFVPARAAEMDLTIAYANFVGTEGDMIYGGRSIIAGPDARPLAAAGGSEALLVADISRPIAADLRSAQLKDFRKV
ncbi:putative amidohydrolase [Palleronia aestuarii]|uniref:Putative amidohydrolase n=1 Tax=Palleronia aestuarii TaxID=568105 RepID=A0A2W7MQ06_9RHOB|nr:carbon-nitrogen hydrolase family protein [Palleronia aestuarii]PZX10285.1 putative amidohydrolase [Palleronia aestuarii]